MFQSAFLSYLLKWNVSFPQESTFQHLFFSPKCNSMYLSVYMSICPYNLLHKDLDSIQQQIQAKTNKLQIHHIKSITRKQKQPQDKRPSPVIFYTPPLNFITNFLKIITFVWFVQQMFSKSKLKLYANPNTNLLPFHLSGYILVILNYPSNCKTDPVLLPSMLDRWYCFEFCVFLRLKMFP